MRPLLPLLAVLLLLCLLPPAGLGAQSGIGYENAFPNLTFDLPVEIQHAGDGSDRLFVVEQSGRIKVFANDPATTTQQTFLDLSDLISVSTGQEVGLLGLAFHPDYADNGYCYVYHTRQSQVDGVNVELVLARYQVDPSNPDRAAPSSRLEIFSFDKNQSNSNHNGGKIAFGPDGYLYVSIGDGGGGGDPEGNAQDLSNVFGSLLRIDVDVDGSNPLETNPDAPDGRYEIPTDNPRVGSSGLDEHYAWGLRNTWKFSFDPATGRLWGGDVGQSQFEEINLITKGGNYGWNRFEGNGVFSSSTSLVTTPDRKPVYTYGRSDGDKSITVGYVYRGPLTTPTLQDKLIFGDYISGRVWALDYDAASGEAAAELLFRADGQNVSSFGLDQDGQLYFSGYGRAASLYRIIDEDEQEPTTTEIDGIGQWEALPDGLSGTVQALTTGGNGTIYAAGSGGTVAVFTPGQGWSSLGSAANGAVNALALSSDGTLYAGGDFTSIGGITAQRVAAWNGTAWEALAGGTSGPVLALGISPDGALYAGGAFTTAGGTTVNNLGRWNGSSWSALTDAQTQVAGTNNEVRSIAFDTGGTLYVGGNFASAGDRTANRIATFDGERWGTLGSGTSGFVQAIAVTETDIYLGGNFALAGGATVNRIVRWDRAAASYRPIGGGVSGNVNALYFGGGYLYAGGSFVTALTAAGEAYRVNNIARWSAATGWEALGTEKEVGTDNQVNALLPAGDGGLYAGGSFAQAGTVAAPGIARWRSLLIPDGAVFELQPQHRLDLRLDVRGGSTANRAAVIGWARNGGRNQQWTFYYQGNNVYELEPRHAPGMRLDVNNASTGDDVELILWPRHGLGNQRWKALPAGDGTFRFEPQHAPGKRLDIKNRNGQHIALSSVLDSGNSQRWRLLPVGGAASRQAATVAAPADVQSAAMPTLTLYPNPADQQLTIESDRAYRLLLFDAAGRQVMDRQQAAGVTELAVGHLPAGVYVARIQVRDAEVISRRVVIE